MTTDKAIDILLWTNLAAGAELPDDVNEAVAFLMNAAEENERLKKSLEEWANGTYLPTDKLHEENKRLKAERNFLAELRSEVLALGGTEYLRSLKAEVERLKETLEADDVHLKLVAARAEKAEAEVERLGKALDDATKVLLILTTPERRGT